jgi:hypothetical protein
MRLRKGDTGVKYLPCRDVALRVKLLMKLLLTPEKP